MASPNPLQPLVLALRAGAVVREPICKEVQKDYARGDLRLLIEEVEDREAVRVLVVRPPAN